jgi:hypothetical protein
MPNTVYGPFASTTVVNGVTAANATIMNNIQTQSSVALHGFNGDLVTPFVLSGCVATRDGTNLKQLNVTAGSVYIKMTDNTIGLIATIASVTNQFLTSTPSTTYFLDINPDGTWSFATTHSAVTNHLTIASCTTDGSGNINVVTDARATSTTLLSGAVGAAAFHTQVAFSPTSTYDALNIISKLGTDQVVVGVGDSGYANGAGFYIFAAGTDVTSGYALVDADGAGIGIPGKIKTIGGQTTAGAFGVPVTIASTGSSPIHITTTTAQQTILSITAPATGMYRANLSIYVGGTTPATITAAAKYFSGNNNTNNPGIFFSTSSGALNAFSIAAQGENATEPVTFYAAATKTILIYYTNATATPNDFVSATIERLS